MSLPARWVTCRAKSSGSCSHWEIEMAYQKMGVFLSDSNLAGPLESSQIQVKLRAEMLFLLQVMVCLQNIEYKI
jgi:hypothetical protein